MNTAPNARIIGLSLENTLDQMVHPTYLREGLLADVWHEGQRGIWTKDGLKPVDSRPDYGGVLPGGRYFVMDAKVSAEARYRHNKKRLHQLWDLWNAHRSGGLAGILVVNWELERGWWLIVQPEWEREEFTSTLLGDPERTREVPPHPMFEHEFMPDWLMAARQAEGSIR